MDSTNNMYKNLKLSSVSVLPIIGCSKLEVELPASNFVSSHETKDQNCTKYLIFHLL